MLSVESALGMQAGAQVRVLRPEGLKDRGSWTQRAQGLLAGGSGQQSPHRCFLTVICQDGEKKGPVQAVRKALRLSCCVTLSRSPSLPVLQVSPIFI